MIANGFLLLVLLSVSFFSAAPIHAKEQLSSAEKELESELRWLQQEALVYVASRHEEKLQDAPAKVIVIGREQIKERNYVTLIDLLEDLPGVDVFHNSNEESKSIISLRSIYGNNKFIVLMDGNKISAGTNEQIPIEENFPLFMVRRVEILYGPASALYGADAFAGVINLIAERAEDVNGVEIGLMAGSNGYNFLNMLVGLEIAEGIQFRVLGDFHGSNNSDLAQKYPENYEMPVGRTDRFSGETGSYLIDVNMSFYEKLSIGFRQSYYRSLTENGVKPSATIYGKDPKWETLLRNLYGEYKFKPFEGVSANTSFSYGTYELLPDSGYNNIFTAFNRMYKYARDSRLKFEQQVYVDLSPTQSVTAGIIYEDFYSLPKTGDLDHPFDPNKAIGEQVFYHLGSNNTLPLSIPEIRYNNLGGYLQVNSEWSESLLTTFGMRYDKNSRYGASINPRGSVIFKPNDRLTSKLLYGESFLAPSPKFTYGIYGSFTGVPNVNGLYESFFMHIPNPDLKPEKGKFWELELNYMLSDEFNITVSGLYCELNNMIMPKYVVSDRMFDGGLLHGWESYVNTGKAQSHEGEIRFDYQPSTSLKFWGSYTYQDGRVDEGTGGRVELPYISRNKFKGGVTYRHGKFSITPRLQVVGRQNHYSKDPNDASKRLKVKGYQLFHLTVRGNDLIEGLSLTFDVRNLFDQKYYAPGPISAPRSSFVSSPQDGRRFALKLEYRF